MGAPALLREDDGPVAWLRLNRPEAFNALNYALVEEITEALQAIQGDSSVRVVVVTGSGKAFCAGADLKTVGGTVEDPDALLKFARTASGVVDRIAALEKPVIAAINGIAAAGGLEIALGCDLVMAAESARIGEAHANFGLLPGGGGAARLARVVGPMVAKRLAFTGDLVPASDLVPCGLVSEVVPDDELERRVGELAHRIAAESPLGLAHMKRLIDDALDQSLATSLRAEHQALYAHAHSADVREGLNAFREKRVPQYVGR